MKSKGICKQLLLIFVRLFHIIKDIILYSIFQIIADKKLQFPPLTANNKYLTHSAFELARMIRNRELTSYQLTLDCVNRLNQVNPVINAIVDGPFIEALAQAAMIDMKIQNRYFDAEYISQHPLLGVPFTVKDSTAVKGQLHTIGLVSRRNELAQEDADCVTLIKNAGAIILATTNIPEVNRWQETRNNIIGQTRNPYDSRRTVGGSSGGEAAIIAACGSPFGIGTDIGGSIRMPAFFCGIYGHKPTVGLISMKGCTMRTGEESSTMVVVGPMCRSAFDLRPLLSVSLTFYLN